MDCIRRQVRRKQSKKLGRQTEPGHVPVLATADPRDLIPAPENESIYRPVLASDPEIQALSASVTSIGLQEPIVVTLDNYVISGHRRRMAAIEAGLDSVPIRVEQFRRADDPDRFLRLLREHNRQRDKSFDEKLREELVSLDGQRVYQSLIEYRAAASIVKVDCLNPPKAAKRCKISDAKRPMLDAIVRVINSRREYWPLSDRSVHYGLLNNPPLRHTSKSRSKYRNDHKSYKDLCELLTRARLEGLIPFEAIGDETRPFTSWDVYREPRAFVRDQLQHFANGYWRDLMQSQPNHVEIVGEKNTVLKIINKVAMKYCIPTTMGRGYSSLAPRYEMAQRFKKSGKSKLVVLLCSDHDPDGMQIADSFTASMRDEFGISNIHAIKVALTHEQVQSYRLPVGPPAKKGSPNYTRFVRNFGDHVYELEALEPAQLQTVLQEAIDSVIDTNMFNRELDEERQDAAHLEGVRRIVRDALQVADCDDEVNEESEFEEE